MKTTSERILEKKAQFQRDCSEIPQVNNVDYNMALVFFDLLSEVFKGFKEKPEIKVGLKGEETLKWLREKLYYWQSKDRKCSEEEKFVSYKIIIWLDEFL